MASQNIQPVSAQQPTRYYEYPRSAEDKKQTEEAGRFDQLRSAFLASSTNDVAARKDANPKNYSYDPSPALPPPHHKLAAMSQEERKDWQQANGNPNYDPSKDAAIEAEHRKQAEEARQFDHLSNGPLASPNTDSALKKDAIPSPNLPPPHHNLTAMSQEERKDWQQANGNPNYDPSKDTTNQAIPLAKDSSNLANNSSKSGSGFGSGLAKQDSAATIGGMKTDAYLHNISVEGSGVITSMKYNRQSPNGTLHHSPNQIRDSSKPTSKPSEFASLKPNVQSNEDLGVFKDSSATKADDAAPIVVAPVVGQGKAHEWSYDSKNKEDNSKEMLVGGKAMDHPVKDSYTDNEEPRAKLEEDRSEKLGSANDEKVSSAAVIAGAPNAIAGAPTATAVAPLNHTEPANDSSLLHSNKSGESFKSPGGTHHSKSGDSKASVWQKITCRAGSKTKPGKHYVNPAGVVNHNQGLK